MPWLDNKTADSQGHPAFSLCARLRSIWEQHKLLSDGIDEEEVISEDFQGLCAEVKAVFTELGCLEMSLRQQLLVNIGRILQDQSSMEALEASVSEHDGGGRGLPKSTWPHLPHLYLSWSRACAVAGRWSLWTAQQAASLSVWCSRLENWWWNLLPLSSICWKH